MELRSTKLLFLYKSFLFRKVFFTTKDKSLKKIVKGLNIKKRKKRIEYIYNEAIREINTYYFKDLCDFKNNQCIAQRLSGRSDINGCCIAGCPNFGDKGCITINLTCKLIYCKSALGNIKRLKFRNIKILKLLSLRQRIILKTDFFSSKEEIIKDLYYGLIIYGFRCLGKEFSLFKRRLRRKRSSE